MGTAVDSVAASENVDQCRLYIGNLSAGEKFISIEEEHLTKIFAKFGEIIKLKLAVGPDGRSLDHATVQFERKEDAATCIEGMHNKQIDGRPVVVKY